MINLQVEGKNTIHMTYAFIILMLCLMPRLCSAKHLMIVFIHGTQLQSIRHTKQYAYSCDLMHDLGLIKLNLKDWDKRINPPDTPCAAIYIAKSFDVCLLSRHENPEDEAIERHYYTFGWSGELSHEARKTAAEDFYYALHNEYTTLTQKYPGVDVEIELYGHSHGNQLIFQLAVFRDINPDDTWSINCAILSAAPLHYEMARHAIHPLFKAFVNIYSKGDAIQTLDFISVPKGTCRRAFHEIPELSHYLQTTSKCIIDICIGAHNHYDFFGHGSFFALDRYTPHPTISRNLRQNYRKLIAQLHPLPLVAFYPLIVPQDLPNGYQFLSANIFHYDNQLAVITYSNITPETIAYVLFPADFFKIRDATQAVYRSQGYISELSKLYWACLHSLYQLFHRSKDQSKN